MRKVWKIMLAMAFAVFAQSSLVNAGCDSGKDKRCIYDADDGSYACNTSFGRPYLDNCKADLAPDPGDGSTN